MSWRSSSLRSEWLPSIAVSEFALSIAGVRMRLRGAERSIARVRRRYAPYRCGGKAELTLDWEEGEPPRGAGWPDPSVTLLGRGRRVLSRRDFHGEIGPRGGTLITDSRATALDSVLRIILSEILAGRGGMLVHSAAIGDRLFPGRSESGKSTLASLSPRRRVLSDELVAVVPAGRGFVQCGTPFWGSFARGTSTERRPVRNIYFLQRRKRESIRDITPAEAVTRLMECILCFVDTPERGKTLLRAASKLVTSAPCRVLSYDVDKTPYRALDRRLREAERP